MVTRRVSPRKTTLCEVIVINSGNFIGQFYNWTLNIHHWTLGCPRIVFFNLGWLAIFRHVGNDLNVPLGVSSMHQTIKGDPRDGWDELKPDRSYLSHFPPWYSKSGHFPIEIPIKNEKWPLNLSYGSIFYNSENPFVGSFLHNIVHHLVHHTPFTKYGHLCQCSQLCKPW